eukprot:6475219-Amphidinium_carterae.3
MHKVHQWHNLPCKPYLKSSNAALKQNVMGILWCFKPLQFIFPMMRVLTAYENMISQRHACNIHSFFPSITANAACQTKGCEAEVGRDSTW